MTTLEEISAPPDDRPKQGLAIFRLAEEGGRGFLGSQGGEAAARILEQIRALEVAVSERDPTETREKFPHELEELFTCMENEGAPELLLHRAFAEFSRGGLERLHVFFEILTFLDPSEAMLTPTLGVTFRVARKAKGLQQKDLAQLFAVDQALVSRWEKGDKPLPQWARGLLYGFLCHGILPTHAESLAARAAWKRSKRPQMTGERMTFKPAKRRPNRSVGARNDLGVDD